MSRAEHHEAVEALKRAGVDVTVVVAREVVAAAATPSSAVGGSVKNSNVTINNINGNQQQQTASSSSVAASEEEGDKSLSAPLKPSTSPGIRFSPSPNPDQVDNVVFCSVCFSHRYCFCRSGDVVV